LLNVKGAVRKLADELYHPAAPSSVALEKLDLALVIFCGFQRTESPQVTAFASCRITLS
jgi:hypothetical protein